MKRTMYKILGFFVLVLLIWLGKFFAYDYAISTGKRTGNLTKISKKGSLIKTWEGTIDEGSGDKLTSYFSVRDEALAQTLYEYEGQKITIYYDQTYFGWPWETNYNVTSWKPISDSGSKGVKSSANQKESTYTKNTNSVSKDNSREGDREDLDSIGQISSKSELESPNNDDSSFASRGIKSTSPNSNYQSSKLAAKYERMLEKMETTLFCSFLGALAQNPDLYADVKRHIAKSNPYLIHRYNDCNQ